MYKGGRMKKSMLPTNQFLTLKEMLGCNIGEERGAFVDLFFNILVAWLSLALLLCFTEPLKEYRSAVKT